MTNYEVEASISTLARRSVGTARKSFENVEAWAEDLAKAGCTPAQIISYLDTAAKKNWKVQPGELIERCLNWGKQKPQTPANRPATSRHEELAEQRRVKGGEWARLLTESETAAVWLFVEKKYKTLCCGSALKALSSRMWEKSRQGLFELTIADWAGWGPRKMTVQKSFDRVQFESNLAQFLETLTDRELNDISNKEKGEKSVLAEWLAA